MSASQESSPVTPSADESRQIAATRLFNAPRELVWRMWTDPEHIIHWWGPNGFTNTIHEMDVRPGGKWTFVMHGPDGTDYMNKCVYVDVAAPERLAWDHLSGPVFRAFATFAARGEQTEVTMRMEFASAEQRNDIAEKVGAVEGLNQTFNHLGEKLAAITANDLVLTRTFDALRELVWKAWTDEKQLAQWWSPQHFSNPNTTVDLRPGGAIRNDMRGPDGTIYPMHGTFVDIREPERLVLSTRAFEDAAGNAQLETMNVVTFEEDGGKTKLTMRATVVKMEGAAVAGVAGMRQGWNESLDKLEVLVKRNAQHNATTSDDAAAAPVFTMTRLLDAPRDLVWRVWTEREHLLGWWGPKGVTMVHCTADIRPGGKMHYGFTFPNNDAEVWGLWTFREVTPPERLVFESSFSDRDGGITRHPMAPTWPLEMLSTIEFEEAENGRKTLVTLQWTPINATKEEEAVFAAGMPSMTVGWGGTFEQLEAYLATRS